jgi:hypothetical protein
MIYTDDMIEVCFWWPLDSSSSSAQSAIITVYVCRAGLSDIISRRTQSAT